MPSNLIKEGEYSAGNVEIWDKGTYLSAFSTGRPNLEKRSKVKPNIVFFMTDQLSAKWLEVASAGVCPTPNIDRLCRNGVRFTNAITSNPVCQPTRATIATGLTTRGHGVLENGYKLDSALPTFMQILKKAGWRTGQIEKTYIIFLADHGELLFDHGFGGKEERHYDACIRVPLIIAGPDLEKGLICDEMVQLEDICPTVLEMAKLNPPSMPQMGPYLKVDAEGIPVLPGKSLLPLCRNDLPPNWREAAYSESYNAIWSVSPGDWARTIRTKEFRYTFYANSNGEQLFNLRDDPDEQQNIVANPAYAKVRQELRDRLMELIVMQDYPKTRRELFALGVH